MPLRRQPDDRNRRRQRGAALVEAAIVLPVVIAILFGVIEYGFVFKDVLTVSNATRAGARIGAADGNYSLSDYDILTAVKAASTALPNGVIQGVMVYKATAGSSAVPSSCSTAFDSIVSSGSNSGVSSTCNIYGSTTVNATLDSNNFGGTGGKLDSYWPPTTRSASSSSADYVGVYIRVRHDYYTKMFGSSRTLSDQTIMRIEPTS